ncbi:hypothetical protein [Paenarthrobacter sp. NPDC058040]|uniref:hypothetical protein n=1 Tax=unclassified Paenarthrobacter TaxID=2634190 RepID=UPI0036DA7344
MDLLSGVGPEYFYVLIWAATAVFIVAATIARPKRFHSTALAGSLIFATLSGGAGLYVLNHYSDPRWSPQATQLSAPSLSETPLVGQFLGPLDSALSSMVNGVNDFLAFKDALPVALDFFASAGWALLVSFPMGILAAMVNFVLAKRRAATVERYRVTVDQLKADVEKLKLQVQAGLSAESAIAPTEQEFRHILVSTQTSLSPRLP